MESKGLPPPPLLAASLPSAFWQRRVTSAEETRQQREVAEANAARRIGRAGYAIGSAGSAADESEWRRLKKSVHEDKDEAILIQVMKESAVEAVLREQEHLSRAMLLSKQDRFSNDDVSIFRLTKH